MNILEEIVFEKKKEVAQSKDKTSMQSLEKYPLFNKECYSLVNFIRDESKTGIITEFKKRSPSKGWINIDAVVTGVTQGYTSNGASALSVLTDMKFFGGCMEDLQKARINEIPLLRKDFIIDEYQVLESKANGADIILLIAACLSKSEVRQFACTAKNIGLNVLLELHSGEELEMICDEVDVVGINNRNLKTFEVDIENSIQMAKQIPSSCKISESGIDDLQTIELLKHEGFEGFLIGERFMREKDPATAFKNFLNGEV